MQFLHKSSAKSNSSLRRWKPTDHAEMEKMFELIFAAGLMKKDRVEDYQPTYSVLET